MYGGNTGFYEGLGGGLIAPIRGPEKRRRLRFLSSVFAY